MQVLSAKVERTVEGYRGISEVCIMYRRGPRTLPWGTPAFIGYIWDIEPD